MIYAATGARATLPFFHGDRMHWFYQRVYSAAACVGGTEAVAFAVGPTGALSELFHIRPDEASAEQRGKAIAAFKDLVAPCAQDNREDVLEIEPGSAERPAQYCLVRLIRRGLHVTAAVAVIARCRDDDHALERLGILRKVL